MNYFEILGIPWDSDVKTIKRAYAKLLKLHNPEEDPKGYQKLRQAYDAALKYEKSHRGEIKESSFFEIDSINYDENNSKDDYRNEIRQEKNIKLPISINISNDLNGESNEDIKSPVPVHIYDDFEEKSNKEKKELSLDEEIYNFTRRLNDIYNDLAIRKDEKAWQELLDISVVWNIDSFQRIQIKMFEFLLEHKNLPYNVWELLDRNFNWTKNETQLYDKYSPRLVDKILKEIKNKSFLSYDFLENINKDELEEYLEFRKNGYDALKGKDFILAEKYLFTAYEIYNCDPELLKIISEYYAIKGEKNKSIIFLEKVVSINTMDLESALKLENILKNYTEKSYLPRIILAAVALIMAIIFCITFVVSKIS